MRSFFIVLAVLLAVWAVIDPVSARAELLCPLSDSLSQLTAFEANDDPFPMVGSAKALVIYAIFQNSHIDSSNGYQWNDTLSAVSPWMRAIIDSCADPDSCPPQEPSLSDYYWRVSGGKFWLWGDVYPWIIRTPENRGVYDDRLRGVGEAVVDILDSLDTTVDFSQYDADDDGYVDLILMVFRDFLITAGTRYTGDADLAGILPTPASDSVYTTKDAYGPSDKVRIDLRFRDSRPSGIMVEGQNSQLLISQAVHELGHLYFSRGSEPWRFEHLVDIRDLGAMSVTGRMRILSAYERDRLGWLDAATVDSSVVGVALADPAFDGRAIRVYVEPSDTTEFFLIENCVQGSWYDRVHTELPDTCRIDPPEAQGAAIYHVDLRDENELLHIESARGMFSVKCEGMSCWLDATRPNPFTGQDSLGREATDVWVSARDLWGNGNPNTFATYTSPNTNGYDEGVHTVWTGLSVQNIELGAADTLTFDLVFAPPPADSANHLVRPGTGAYEVTWKDWIDLPGDVVVDSMVTLTVAPGTLVRSRNGYDQSALQRGTGADTTKIELVVAGGGTLDVNGTADSMIVFTSTKADPVTADWYGIRARFDGTVDLSYADVGFGMWGVNTGAGAKDLMIANSEIHDNAYFGVYAEATIDTIEIRDSEITGNGYDGIFLVQKKILSGTGVMRNQLYRNKIYSNGLTYGGYQAELYKMPEYGTMTDTLFANDIGAEGEPPDYGLASSEGGAAWGTHYTTLRGDTLRNFAEDALVFSDVDLARVRMAHIKQSGTALAVTDGALVYVDSTKFEGTNYTHIWNDVGGRTCLGDLGGGGCTKGYNAFYQVQRSDSVMITNADTTYTLKGENDWWQYANCSQLNSPPSSFFSGLVDRSPKLGCSAPQLARPGMDLPGDLEDRARSDAAMLTLAVLPNPFSPYTTIRYELPGAVGATPGVDISVYDVAGNRIRTLLRGPQEVGQHEIHWHGAREDGTAAAPGVYFVRLSSGSETRTAKIVLVR